MTSHYKAVFFDLDGTLRIPSPSPTEAFIQFTRSEIAPIDDDAARQVKIWAHRYWGGSVSIHEEMDRLGVISNRSQPFDDVLAQLNITNWFDMTLAAGAIGHWKPHRAVFDHALSFFNGLSAADCLYIGDNYFTDGIGASKAGMVPIIYDPDELYGDMTFSRIDDLAQVTAVINNSVHHKR